MEEFKGLTKKEVEERIRNGQVNIGEVTKTKTIKEIFLSNIITYFNILNIVLALAIIISGIVFNRLFIVNLVNGKLFFPLNKKLSSVDSIWNSFM